MSLAKRLEGVRAMSGPKHSEPMPIWRGPCKDGVTQSLLTRFLLCRERFRLLVVKGLREVDTFNHRIEFGNMWHICEEHYACGLEDAGAPPWDKALEGYCKELCKRYRPQQAQVEHWYQVCLITFPIYLDYWKNHEKRVQRASIMEEETFCVPYKLPSGRVVRLRGKWDGVHCEGKRPDVVLCEHKTKGELDEAKIKRQLDFDLQTMMYIIALEEWCKENDYPSPSAVRYNVIRRPLSGGKHSIKPLKNVGTKKFPRAETLPEYYNRLADLIRGEPEWYFMRWKVGLVKSDKARFRHRCLDNLLEQLCDWWRWISSLEGMADPFADPIHWRTPYMYNVLAEGGNTDLDEYLATGSEVGLQRVTSIFEELD